MPNQAQQQQGETQLTAVRRDKGTPGRCSEGLESVFGGFFIRVVTGVRIEHCRVQALVVLRCI